MSYYERKKLYNQRLRREDVSGIFDVFVIIDHIEYSQRVFCYHHHQPLHRHLFSVPES